MNLRPRNWGKFQHYKDRRPPWIRLYHSLLDDRAFWALKGEDSKYLVAIWLIASESQTGDLPSVEDLSFRLRLTPKKTQELLERLNQWIAYDASKPIAKVEHVATPEAEAETEEIAEAETAPPLPPVVPALAPKPHLPISPGANGEFMAATALLQDCEIAATTNDIRIVAQVIQFEAKARGVEGAMNYLKAEVFAGRARGEPISVFWLKDRKYLAKGKDIYADYVRNTA